MKEYITAGGKDLIMKVLTGQCQVKFTRMVFGDGSIGLSSPRKASSLVHPVASIDVERVESEGNDHFFIKARFTNENLKSSFYMREKGVYASDGKNEILFSYGNAGETANWIPLPTEELIEQWSVLDFMVQPDEEGDINIELKSGIYVLHDDYATDQKAGLVKPDGVTTSVDSDGTIHCIGSNLRFHDGRLETMDEQGNWTQVPMVIPTEPSNIVGALWME